MITIGLVLAIIVILVTVPTAFLGTDSAAFMGDIFGVIVLTLLFVAGISVVVALFKILSPVLPLIIVGALISAVSK